MTTSIPRLFLFSYRRFFQLLVATGNVYSTTVKCHRLLSPSSDTATLHSTITSLYSFLLSQSLIPVILLKMAILTIRTAHNISLFPDLISPSFVPWVSSASSLHPSSQPNILLRLPLPLHFLYLLSIIRILFSFYPNAPPISIITIHPLPPSPSSLDFNNIATSLIHIISFLLLLNLYFPSESISPFPYSSTIHQQDSWSSRVMACP